MQWLDLCHTGGLSSLMLSITGLLIRTHLLPVEWPALVGAFQSYGTRPAQLQVPVSYTARPCRWQSHRRVLANGLYDNLYHRQHCITRACNMCLSLLVQAACFLCLLSIGASMRMQMDGVPDSAWRLLLHAQRTDLHLAAHVASLAASRARAATSYCLHCPLDNELCCAATIDP